MEAEDDGCSSVVTTGVGDSPLLLGIRSILPLSAYTECETVSLLTNTIMKPTAYTPFLNYKQFIKELFQQIGRNRLSIRFQKDHAILNDPLYLLLLSLLDRFQ